MQKILSAKWRCPLIECPPFGDFFIRIWLENSQGKIFCPLIRGVRLLGCPLIGGSTVYKKYDAIIGAKTRFLNKEVSLRYLLELKNFEYFSKYELEVDPTEKIDFSNNF